MAEKAIDPGILASRRYWAEREEENRRATIRDEKEYAKGIREVLEKAAANIQKEIDAFYGRYAAREGITISDAKMRVSTLDIKEYSRKAKQYVADKDFSKQANEEMRIYNLTMKINRLEMLKSNIGLELCASYSELENYFEDSLTKTARKEFRRQAGILGGTVANMEKHAGEIVNGSFRGAKFSERLWANQAYLKTQLDNLLRTGLIQGRNPRELAKSLRKEIETSVYVSERLMRTEMCRVQIGAQLASYQNMGYDKLVIIPEHDERSCDYCETQDGVIVEVAKAVPGVNVPPFHPNCRCSTAAFIEEENIEFKKSFMGIPIRGSETERGFPKTASARVFKNSIVDFETEMEYHIGGNGRISNVEVFAGKGSGRPYIKAYKYANKIGGDPDDWMHMKGIAFIENEYESGRAEIHWSEHEEYGSYDPFVKKWL